MAGNLHPGQHVLMSSKILESNAVEVMSNFHPSL